MVWKQEHDSHQETRTGSWRRLLQRAEVEHNFLKRHPKPETRKHSTPEGMLIMRYSETGSHISCFCRWNVKGLIWYHHHSVHRRSRQKQRSARRPGNGSDGRVTRMRENLSAARRRPARVEEIVLNLTCDSVKYRLIYSQWNVTQKNTGP